MTDTLRMTFDDAAELYDAVRPRYPSEVIDAIDTVLQGTQKRILEIGCGTGQATEPFARKGCQVTALEPGPRLAALAATNLAGFPQVTIEATTFEDWALQEGQYDLVLSATAFHWVSPGVRYVKSAHALTDTGTLALLWNHQADDPSAVGQAIQAVYDQHMPPSPTHPYTTHHPTGKHSKPAVRVSRWIDEINQSQLFRSIRVMEVPWETWYSTEQYLQLLATYSDHRAMPPKNQEALFQGIAEILDQNGGRAQHTVPDGVIFSTGSGVRLLSHVSSVFAASIETRQ